MNTSSLKIDDKTYKFHSPQSWHELTNDEALLVIRLFSSNRPFFIDKSEDLPIKKLNYVLAFMQKSGIDKGVIDEWKTIRDGDDEEGRLIFLKELDTLVNELTAYLFTTIRRFNKPVEVLAPDLLKCPYPQLRIPTKQGDKILYPVSCGKNARSLDIVKEAVFKNMTIYELGQVFTLYERWVEDNSDDTLNTLIATIYREKKENTKQNKATNYSGDIRLPLRGYEATIQRRKDLIAKSVPSHIKDIIAYWIGSCRHHFAALYPDIFSGGSSSDGFNFGYAGIILELSRTSGEGKNQIADQNAHSTMIELQYEMQRAKQKLPATK